MDQRNLHLPTKGVPGCTKNATTLDTPHPPNLLPFRSPIKVNKIAPFRPRFPLIMHGDRCRSLSIAVDRWRSLAIAGDRHFFFGDRYFFLAINDDRKLWRSPVIDRRSPPYRGKIIFIFIVYLCLERTHFFSRYGGDRRSITGDRHSLRSSLIAKKK